MQHLERGRDGRNEFWRYFVVSLVVFIGVQIGSIPLAALALNAMAHGRGDIEQIIADPSLIGVSRTAGLALMMLPFVAGFFTLLLMLRRTHRRNAAEVINGTKRIRWNRVFFAGGVWLALQLVYLGFSYALQPDNFVFRFDAATFFPLLLVSLLFVPLQTSLEELYFRGYMAQGIGAGTGSRWAAMLIPGLIFGLIHFGNPEIEEYGMLLMLPQYILTGLVFGLISTLDDGAECAIGAHAVNNIFACTVLTFKSSALTTDALITQKSLDPGHELVAYLVMSALFVSLLWLRYRWRFSTLQTKVGRPEPASQSYPPAADAGWQDIDGR